VTDTLPADWAYVDNSTTITFPNGSQSSGDAADPLVAGQTLTWDLDQDMGPGQALTVTFEAETTGIPVGRYTINQAQAVGTRGPSIFSASDSAVVTLSDLAVRKTSSVGGSGVQAGDALTYTIVTTNIGGAPQGGIAISDTVPLGTSYVSGTCQVDGIQTVRDEFNELQFDNDDGTRDWSGAWQTNGRVEVREDSGEEFVLQVGGLDGWNVVNGSAWRLADLSGAGSAVLSFDYRRDDLEADNTFYIGVSSDGVSTWDVLESLTGGHDGSYQSTSSDVTPYVSDNTAIGFQSDFSGWLFEQDTMFVDNVEIRFQTTAPGGSPPGLVTAADGYDLTPGGSMIVTFRVTADAPPPIRSRRARQRRLGNQRPAVGHAQGQHHRSDPSYDRVAGRLHGGAPRRRDPRQLGDDDGDRQRGLQPLSSDVARWSIHHAKRDPHPAPDARGSLGRRLHLAG
jgi:uncharacterized repeat protein (TIGR01451 family)